MHACSFIMIVPDMIGTHTERIKEDSYERPYIVGLLPGMRSGLRQTCLLAWGRAGARAAYYILLHHDCAYNKKVNCFAAYSN